MLGVRSDTRGMPDDERQGRSKRVAKEGNQLLRDRTKVSEWRERDARSKW
jgi:hypothetical protein